MHSYGNTVMSVKPSEIVISSLCLPSASLSCDLHLYNIQESLADAKVSAQQQCVCEDP